MGEIPEGEEEPPSLVFAWIRYFEGDPRIHQVELSGRDNQEGGQCRPAPNQQLNVVMAHIHNPFPQRPKVLKGHGAVYPNEESLDIGMVLSPRGADTYPHVRQWVHGPFESNRRERGVPQSGEATVLRSC
jgi:hypothetical protein